MDFDGGAELDEIEEYAQLFAAFRSVLPGFLLKVVFLGCFLVLVLLLHIVELMDLWPVVCLIVLSYKCFPCLCDIIDMALSLAVRNLCCSASSTPH